MLFAVQFLECLLVDISGLLFLDDVHLGSGLGAGSLRTGSAGRRRRRCVTLSTILCSLVNSLGSDRFSSDVCLRGQILARLLFALLLGCSCWCANRQHLCLGRRRRIVLAFLLGCSRDADGQNLGLLLRRGLGSIRCGGLGLGWCFGNCRRLLELLWWLVVLLLALGLLVALILVS